MASARPIPSDAPVTSAFRPANFMHHSCNLRVPEASRASPALSESTSRSTIADGGTVQHRKVTDVLPLWIQTGTAPQTGRHVRQRATAIGLRRLGDAQEKQ